MLSCEQFLLLDRVWSESETSARPASSSTRSGQNQLQGYSGPEVEAIVVGADDRNAHIYLVDNYIKVNCYDDVGFVAIGIGAWHARSQLMQARYSNMWKFNHAVGIAYAAKKQSEIAPGVGAETDLFVVNRDGTNPLMPELKQA